MSNYFIDKPFSKHSMMCPAFQLHLTPQFEQNNYVKL